MFCGWLFVEAKCFFFGHGGFVQRGLWEYSRKAVFVQWQCVEVANISFKKTVKQYISLRDNTVHIVYNICTHSHVSIPILA